MAKYVPIEMVKEYHGKICSHSDVYFSKKGDTLFTGKLCNPRTSAFSATELARQAMFKAAQQAMSVRSKDVTIIESDTAAFKAQSKYKTLQTYLFSIADANCALDPQTNKYVVTWPN